MYEQRAKLTYLTGSIFGKAQELRALLRQMAAAGDDQGEIRLLYQNVNGESQRLVLHIDNAELTIMADDGQSDLRLDLSDSSLHIE